jgi:hypothetical protein
VTTVGCGGKIRDAEVELGREPAAAKEDHARRIQRFSR